MEIPDGILVTKMSTAVAHLPPADSTLPPNVQKAIQGLGERQIKFLKYRMFAKDDEQALMALNDKTLTIKDIEEWNEFYHLKDILYMMRVSELETAMQFSKQMVPKAMMVVAEGLDSRNDRTRMQAAKTLLQVHNLLGDNKGSISMSGIFIQNIRRAQELLLTHQDFDEEIIDAIAIAEDTEEDDDES